MDGSRRKEELNRIKSDANSVVMTGIPLRYRGDVKSENVYKIPLQYLIYNKYNGRIGTEVKSFEAQTHVLDPEKPEDVRVIENFLFASKVDRNEKTMDSLLKNTQQRYGIVTADGVIVDGNRRALLLNTLFNERDSRKLSFKDVEHCQYFLAVILPEDATKRDIQQLETIYQMGEDEKLDYNPIEKYLKCADLKNLGFTNLDIAGFMGEKESQIKDWLSTLKLMEEYLETYGYSGIYTRLDKTEGPFVDLENYLDSYISQSNNTKHVDWSFSPSDISDLKLICFDYIRARYEGKEFREIAKTGINGSLFAYKDIWMSFLDEHSKKVEDDIESIDELRLKHPGEDLSKLLKQRDVDWASKNKGVLEGNLKKHTSKKEDRIDSNQPLKLLEKALNALNSVDTNQEAFFKDEKILENVKEINRICWDFKKLLDRK